MKKIINLLLSTLLLGCGTNSNINLHKPSINLEEKNIEIKKTIYIDSKFDEEEKEAIIAAKNEWQLATKEIVKYNLILNYKINLKSPDTKKTVILTLSAKDNIVQKIDEKVKKEFLTGIVISEETKLILIISDRISEKESFKRLIIKELGHELGINMENNTDSLFIINTNVPNFSCLTKTDLFLFCQKYMCNHEKLNYCN